MNCAVMGKDGPVFLKVYIISDIEKHTYGQIQSIIKLHIIPCYSENILNKALRAFSVSSTHITARKRNQ